MIGEIVAEDNGVILQDRSCLAAVTGEVTATIGPGHEGGGHDGLNCDRPCHSALRLSPRRAASLLGRARREDTSMAADSCSAEALGFSRSERRRFRFPCGHVEPEGTVGDRLRRTAGAVWVRCHACNVIALTKSEQAVSLTTRGTIARSNRT